MPSDTPTDRDEASRIEEDILSSEVDDQTDEADGPSPPRWARVGRVVLEWGLTLAAIAVLWVALGAWRAPDLPEQAPDFSLMSLTGEQITLSEQRGQTVVLNFWAEWCGPCRVEIPAFSNFADQNPEIPVYGIAVDGSRASLTHAATTLGIRYPVLLADEQVQSDYGVSTLPTTVIIGPDGAVRSAHAGIMIGPQLRWATR